jgi:predicted nucleotidyltransferase
VIDVTPKELALVQEILWSHIPAAKVWVFGSRAKGAAKRSSDLDLAIDCNTSLSRVIAVPLADAFEEAPVAFNVDLVDLHSITPEFSALIDAHKIALPGFD